MTPRFHVFRVEEDGALFWIGSAETMQSAQEQVRDTMSQGGAEYVAFDRDTGEKIPVRPDGNGKSTSEPGIP